MLTNRLSSLHSIIFDIEVIFNCLRAYFEDSLMSVCSLWLLNPLLSVESSLAVVGNATRPLRKIPHKILLLVPNGGFIRLSFLLSQRRRLLLLHLNLLFGVRNVVHCDLLNIPPVDMLLKSLIDYVAHLHLVSH